MKLPKMLLLTFFAALMVSPANAATEWVSFPSAGDQVRALMAKPPGEGPFAAVIYNHGTVVRRDGYDTATSRGYDTAGYVEALAEAGFMAMAPIREHLSTADYGHAVTGGVETVNSAVAYLKGRSDVDARRIGAVGFSEGGLVTLWSAIGGAAFGAVVLMSPATIRDAGEWQLKAAARGSNLRKLTMPVMLTVGENDNRSIRKVSKRRLIPNLESAGVPFDYKTDYPGNHKWFWRVQTGHFGDVREFLTKHLQ